MRTARLLTALFGAALAVRVAAACVVGLDGPPVEDERGYVLLATSLAEGAGFALPLPAELVERFGEAAGPRTSFRGPLLPALLAPLVAGGAGPFVLRLVNVLLGALAAPALYVAAQRSIGRRFAIGAALAYAVWPPFVYLSLRTLSEPLSQVLLLLSLAAILPGEPDVTDARPRRTVLGGVLAGLAVLARPSALVPSGFMALGAGSRRRVLACLGALLLLVVPWIVRNTWLHGRPLVTTNSGVTLVGGNCDAAAEAEHPGKWAPPWDAYAGSDEPPDLGMWGWSTLGEGASDRRFAVDALTWMAEDPVRTARLAGFKLVRLFDPDPHSSKPDARLKRLVGWTTVPPVLLLVLLGAPRIWRERRRFAPWLGVVLGTILTALVFYGDTRMRTAADPALLVLAAAGAEELVRRLRTRSTA